MRSLTHRTSASSAALLIGVIGAATLFFGCRGESSPEPPVQLIRNMLQQPRYNPQSYSTYFGDHRTMREPVPGTVSRETPVDDDEVTTGRLDDQTGYVLRVPGKVALGFGGADAMLARGQERFNIYCAPCHDRTGKGNGTVVQRGFPKPPSLHEPRVKQLPDGQLYATIANGVRNMPAYSAQIPVRDRWAIVAYVRALELSQEPPK